MPDVPERCWYCEREMTTETIRVECAYCGADVARVYEWLDALDAARAEAERLRAENERLYRRIERLAAKSARQRAVISRLQAAVERRNSQERIEALRRKLSDEKRLLDRIEALERRNSEIAQLIIDAITWFYDEDTGSVTVTDDDPRGGLERLRQALLMLDPAAAARFPQFYRW